MSKLIVNDKYQNYCTHKIKPYIEDRNRVLGVNHKDQG